MNFGQLKAAIAAYLDRSDLSAQIPNFVQMAEARLARDVRSGKLIGTGTLTITTGNSSVAMPSDFAAGVAVAGTGGAYTFVPPATLTELAAQGLGERCYSIFGAALRVPMAVTSDAVFSITYYAKPAALSADADTNALLTDYPGLYLYCALAEGAVFLADDARVPLWEAKYRKELEDLRTATWGENFAAEQYAQSVA